MELQNKYLLIPSITVEEYPPDNGEVFEFSIEYMYFGFLVHNSLINKFTKKRIKLVKSMDLFWTPINNFYMKELIENGGWKNYIYTYRIPDPILEDNWIPVDGIEILDKYKQKLINSII